jgi:predicted lipid-binding transport protein (Tim44 family)
MRRRVMLSLLAGTLALTMIALVGCDTGDSTTIVLDATEDADETTGTLTPLERGQVRRQALRDIEAAVEAWVSGDRESMADHFSDEMLARFTDQWDELAEQGHSIRHVHEVMVLDVTEMNATGTQVLAKYKFLDESVVVDESGRTIEGPVNAEADAQLTAERADDGSWVIVRIIGPVESVR